MVAGIVVRILSRRYMKLKHYILQHGLLSTNKHVLIPFLYGLKILYGQRAVFYLIRIILIIVLYTAGVV